jgi:small subunit ribosomal protein S18
MAESRGGRPIAASMRPTGGDKASIGKKQYFRRKKVCRFSVEKANDITWKQVEVLKNYIGDSGKIMPRRITGTSPAFHRRLVRAIKQARHLALLPYSNR